MRRIYEKNYYVYILTNTYNSVLYIGVTSNLVKRVFEHKHKLVKGFTSKYYVNKLVYTAIFISPYEAITYEKKLKGWTRAKKNNLISEYNPGWREISI